MAISLPTELFTIQDTATNGTVYSFNGGGSVTLTGSRLYLLSVFNATTGAPTVGGTSGATWTQRGTTVSQDITTNTLWTAEPPSDLTGTLTLTWGTNRTSVVAYLVEIASGWNTVSFLQQAVSRNQAATATWSVGAGQSWSNAALGDSLICAFFGSESGGAFNWTSATLGTLGTALKISTDSINARWGYQVGSLATVSAVNGEANALVGAAIEIKAAAAATPGPSIACDDAFGPGMFIYRRDC